MLIHCPNCNAKYNLPPAALGTEGRDMRCVKCGHEWFQKGSGVAQQTASQANNRASASEPDPFDPPIPSVAMLDTEPEQATDDPFEESQAEAINEDDMGIPEGIKPKDFDDDIEVTIGDDGNDHEELEEETSERPKKRKTSAMAKVNGIFAALLIWLVLCGALILWRGPILSAWPQLAGLYDMVGIELPLKGKEFVVESLDAQLEKHDNGKSFIVLKGRVLNMSSKPAESPKMIATVHDSTGKKVGSWIVHPPKGLIESGAGFSISTDNPAITDDISDVRLSFQPEFKH